MNNPSFIEYLSLGILILLAITIFLVRIFVPDIDKSPLVDTLFSFFEITFSVSIGFIIQRLDSAKKFQENLRKYGLSAYRRISDISKSLDRAKAEINRRRDGLPKSQAYELDIINAIIEGANDTVKSSVTDWMDIIGEDLKTQEKIQELEKEILIRKQSKNESERKELKIQELQNEIQILKARLPYSLQDEQKMSMQEDVDLALSKMVSATSSFILKVRFTNTDNIDDFIFRVKQRKPYTFTMQREYSEAAAIDIRVYDNQQALIGQVVNTISKDDDWYFYHKIWEHIKDNGKYYKDETGEWVLVEAAEVINTRLERDIIIIRVPMSSYFAA